MRETLVKTEEFKDSPLGKIPTGWQVGRLSNFYAVPARNGLYKSPQYYGRGVLMIHMPQMFRGLEIDISDAARVEVNPTELERFELKPGDLVFARRSLNLEGAGRCSLVPELPEPVTFESSIIRVRLYKEQLRSAFANYFLNSEIGFRLRLPLIRQVAVSGVSSEDIASIPILVPPIPEQEGIIEIIGTVDKTIAHTSSLIAKLKQMKAGLLHDLLTRGLDENGELRDAIGHPEHFKDSPLGQIPKNWEVVPLTTLCHKITDGSHQSVKTSDSGVPFLYVSCVRDGQILWEQAAKIPEQTYAEISKGREPVPGLILYTAVGSYGHAALVREKYQFSFQRHIAYILANSESVEPAYLAMWLNSPQGRKYADKVALGNAQKTVTLGALASFPVLLPEIDEQRRITEILDTHETRIRTEEAYREKLKLQKQGLMHDLLTGKVRIKDVDKFTPASDTV